MSLSFSYILLRSCLLPSFFFFFNDPATTEIYTLSLHDALPICRRRHGPRPAHPGPDRLAPAPQRRAARSEEHTSELQSQSNLVCRLLLEKKKEKKGQRLIEDSQPDAHIQDRPALCHSHHPDHQR